MHQGFLLKHSKWVSHSIRLVDIALILASAWGSFGLRFGFNVAVPSTYLFAILFGTVLAFLGLYVCRIYQPMRGQNLWRILLRVFLAFVLTVAVLSLFAFLTKTGAQFSRQWLSGWMLLSFACCICFRVVLTWLLRMLRQKGFNIRHIAVVGSGELAQHVLNTLKAAEWAGYQVVKVFDDQGSGLKALEGVNVTPMSEDFSKLNLDKLDEVWIAVPLSQADSIKLIIHGLRFSTVSVRLVPDVFGVDLLNHSMTEVAGLPTLNLRATPMAGGGRILKSCEDKLLSLFILICISPVMLVLAVLVKATSAGPVFYRQERVTWNNRSFGMLKFRSMPVNAESKTGAVWAKSGENRATAIGAFMRKTSLDELPQFLNVLKGDMSIVGPRPERPVFVEKFKHDVPGYMQKHMMKAGITGWAQINGWRGDTDLAKRIECDLYYIEHWSLWLDIKIIFLTIFKGFINKNAY
jgi:putative colanic acid biosysnthesis UDP-glucose lipid carrier transferase